MLVAVVSSPVRARQGKLIVGKEFKAFLSQISLRDPVVRGDEHGPADKSAFCYKVGKETAVHSDPHETINNMAMD